MNSKSNKSRYWKTIPGFNILAEMEGFEPPHALRRLADFESAPFSHLGTSPLGDIITVYAQKIKAFSPVPAPVPSACRFPHNSPVCEGEDSAGNPWCRHRYTESFRRIDPPDSTVGSSRTGSWMFPNRLPGGMENTRTVYAGKSHNVP